MSYLQKETFAKDIRTKPLKILFFLPKSILLSLNKEMSHQKNESEELIVLP